VKSTPYANIFIKEDGRAIMTRSFLKDLFAIYEHYMSREEEIFGIMTDASQRKSGGYEVTVTSSSRQEFDVKVRIVDQTVLEYAREEIQR